MNHNLLNAPRVYAVLLLAVAAPILVGGSKLIALGGSPYYLGAAVALAAAALLLWRGSRWGLWVYGALMVATAAWTLVEVGFDGWAMMPRLALLSVLGSWLLLPVARRGLTGGPDLSSRVLRFAAFLIVIAVVAPPLAAVLGNGSDTVEPITVPLEKTVSGANPDWAYYGSTAGGTRFSPLAQINLGNVSKMEKAWTYHFGGVIQQSLEVTPLKIDDSLYACSSSNIVVSLDPENGMERWRYDPQIDTHDLPFPSCRGVAYYRLPGASGECAERIYTNTVDARLIALDARTGRRCESFGVGGEISLLKDLGEVKKGYYFPTSAPTIVRGRIVVGARVYDGQYWGEPSGVIRAFDAVTGAFAWAFDVGRLDRQSEPSPGETYTLSTPNSWGPMSADEELGLVYAPTGNSTGSDFYGAGRRPFDEQYASSVVAIDGETGRLRWSFQTTHHDLWDYDVPAQPTLVDLPTKNGVEKALIQPTKRGEVFLLDRVTGVPLAKVAERPVSQVGAAPGERVAPTQPFSIEMPSLGGAPLSEAQMWGLTPFDQLWCRIKFRESRYDGPLTPPGPTWSIQYPGVIGGTNWGSASVDTDKRIIVVATSHVAIRVQLVPREEADALAKPLGAGGKVSELGGIQLQAGTPFGARIPEFLSPLEVPCQQPPWGTLHAIDLKTQKLLWSRPLGTARDSGPLNLRSLLPIPVGVPVAGGALVTRGGLTFIGASVEREFRAIETDTGKTVWQTSLPAAGNATPMSYIGSRTGRQFIVMPAGGHMMLRAQNGDALVAYSLSAD